MDIVLSFEPSDVRRLERSDVAVTLVNDTAYALAFAMLRRGGDGRGRLLCAGTLEGATQLTLAVVPMSETAAWGEFKFQAVMWGEAGADFEPAQPLDVDCRIDVAELRRESAYKNPVYSEHPAHEVHLLRDGVAADFGVPDAERLRRAMSGGLDTGKRGGTDRALREKLAADSGRGSVGGAGRGTAAGRGRELSPYKLLPPIEVDLHIHELVDTTAGLDNGAMLQLQLDTVRRTMREHRRRRGQEIIFIHGKGDGVLRRALLELLRREFPTAETRDASFRRYGFGATHVTVHA